MESIVEQVFKLAVWQPEKLALTDGKRSVTYRQLVEGVLFADAVLKRHHLAESGRIIVAASKQISFVYLYLAAHLNGVTVVPIDPETNDKRFRHIYSKVDPQLIVGFRHAENCPAAELSDFDGCLEQANHETAFPSETSNADIIFTTGTTGEPKGVLLSHGNISAAARNINSFIRNSSDDIEMLALPVSHSFGLGRLRCALSNGQTLVLLGSFVNMKRFFRFMEEYKVNGLGMVPSSWAFVKKMSGERLFSYADQLHYIEIGSAPMPLEDKRLLSENLPHTRICMHYGLTEASRSTFIEFHEDAGHLNTVGKPTPGVDVKVLDEQGRSCAINVEGEICVKGDAMSKGYFRLPEITQESFYGDYFRTGDWGSMDSEGYLSLLSRKKELINVGGKKVSPVEVEEVLKQVEGIADSACIGIPDPDGILGEVVKAFIVITQPAETVLDNINVRIGSRLEAYKMPAQYEVIDQIPYTSSGKVQRSLLKM